MQIINGQPTPALGPEYFQTFRASAPLSSHWRKATCAEYECDAYLNGFALTVDLSTDLGQKQYHYATHDRSRRCTEHKIGETLVQFIYGPGNEGFAPQHNHRVGIGRPPVLMVAQGDWRGNPRQIPVRVHRTVEDWVDEFANHQDKVKTLIERG